jgi:murein DD-endopeptidase MepM/ murein hydrolase activator NlpD
VPGPLDNLPRPISERAGAGRRRRRLLTIGTSGAIVALLAFAVVTSSPGTPFDPAGAVAGVVATGASATDHDLQGGAHVAPGGSSATSPAAALPTRSAEAEPSTAPVPTTEPDPTPALAATLTGYQSPLPHGRLTLPFGPSPWGSRIVDGEKMHDGIDLATFCGDRVVAAHDGIVLTAGRHYDKYMGWIGDLQPYLDRLDKKKLYPTLPIVIVTDDGNGYRSIYAHFSKVAVKKGDTVQAGQFIGYEGRTGRASGCHVHYGLFSPLETATFGIDPAVVKRMKVPKREIARVDPLIVLPEHAEKGSAPATAVPDGSGEPDRPASP